jgi:hypothetical protein
MISESWQSAKHKLSEKLWANKNFPSIFLAFYIKMPPIGACEAVWERKCSIGCEKRNNLITNVDRWIKIYVKQKCLNSLKTFKWDLFVIWSLLTSNKEGEEVRMSKNHKSNVFGLLHTSHKAQPALHSICCCCFPMWSVLWDLREKKYFRSQLKISR